MKPVGKNTFLAIAILAMLGDILLVALGKVESTELLILVVLGLAAHSILHALGK